MTTNAFSYLSETSGIGKRKLVSRSQGSRSWSQVAGRPQGGHLSLLIFKLMIFMWEKAASHKWVDPKSAVKLNSHLLWLGYFCSRSSFQKSPFVPGIALDLISVSLCKQWCYFGRNAIHINTFCRRKTYITGWMDAKSVKCLSNLDKMLWTCAS